MWPHSTAKLRTFLRQEGWLLFLFTELDKLISGESSITSLRKQPLAQNRPQVVWCKGRKGLPLSMHWCISLSSCSAPEGYLLLRRKHKIRSAGCYPKQVTMYFFPPYQLLDYANCCPLPKIILENGRTAWASFNTLNGIMLQCGSKV